MIMEKAKKTNVKEISDEGLDLYALRDKRRADFVAHMEKYPKTLEAGERYRDGRRRFFGDFLFSLMDMAKDEDCGFGAFTEKILTENDEALQYEFFTLDKLLEKVKDPELEADLRLVGYGILSDCEAFYLAVGAFIGQHYQILDPAAQQEIDNIGKLMAEEKVFPLIPKQIPAAGTGECATAGVIPARVREEGKSQTKARGRIPEKGMLNIGQVAEKLGVSVTWLYRKVKAGVLPHVKIGGVVRIVEKDLEIWMAGHKVKGALKI